jgi:hypothetical protein
VRRRLTRGVPSSLSRLLETDAARGTLREREAGDETLGDEGYCDGREEEMIQRDRGEIEREGEGKEGEAHRIDLDVWRRMTREGGERDEDRKKR